MRKILTTIEYERPGSKEAVNLRQLNLESGRNFVAHNNDSNSVKSGKMGSIRLSVRNLNVKDFILGDRTDLHELNSKVTVPQGSIFILWVHRPQSINGLPCAAPTPVVSAKDTKKSEVQ